MRGGGGDRALFFLRDFEGANPVVYDVFGWNQGYWEVNDNDVVNNHYAPQLMPDGRPLPLDELLDIIRAELADGPPPPGYLVDQYLVTLDEAPIVGDQVEHDLPVTPKP